MRRMVELPQGAPQPRLGRTLTPFRAHPNPVWGAPNTPLGLPLNAIAAGVVGVWCLVCVKIGFRRKADLP